MRKNSGIFFIALQFTLSNFQFCFKTKVKEKLCVCTERSTISAVLFPVFVAGNINPDFPKRWERSVKDNSNTNN